MCLGHVLSGVVICADDVRCWLVLPYAFESELVRRWQLLSRGLDVADGVSSGCVLRWWCVGSVELHVGQVLSCGLERQHVVVFGRQLLSVSRCDVAVPRGIVLCVWHDVEQRQRFMQWWLLLSDGRIVRDAGCVSRFQLLPSEFAWFRRRASAVSDRFVLRRRDFVCRRVVSGGLVLFECAAERAEWSVCCWLLLSSWFIDVDRVCVRVWYVLSCRDECGRHVVSCWLVLRDTVEQCAVCVWLLLSCRHYVECWCRSVQCWLLLSGWFILLHSDHLSDSKLLSCIVCKRNFSSMSNWFVLQLIWNVKRGGV